MLTVRFMFTEQRLKDMLPLIYTAIYLQVRAEEGLPFGVLIVVSHQHVEQRRRLSPQGAQFGDAALENLAAESFAQRHTTLKEHRRELMGQRVSVLKAGSGWGLGLENTVSAVCRWGRRQRKQRWPLEMSRRNVVSKTQLSDVSFLTAARKMQDVRTLFCMRV